MTAPFPIFDEPPPCAQPGVDPERFHPRSNATRAQREEVAAICLGDDHRPPCPVLDACLAYALTHDVSGIWGGLNAGQRERIRKQRRIRAVPVVGQVRVVHQREAS